MDCSTPGSSVHGILQARVLEWVAISFSRGSSRPGDQTCVSCDSCIGRQVLYQYTTGEACTVAFVLEIFTCSWSPWFGQNLFPSVWSTSPRPNSLLVILKAIVRVPLVTQMLPLPTSLSRTSLKLPSGWDILLPHGSTWEWPVSRPSQASIDPHHPTALWLWFVSHQISVPSKLNKYLLNECCLW